MDRFLGNQRVVNSVTAIIEYVDNIRDGRVIKGAAIETCCGASNLAEQLLDQDWPIEDAKDEKEVDETGVREIGIYSGDAFCGSGRGYLPDRGASESDSRPAAANTFPSATG